MLFLVKIVWFGLVSVMNKRKLNEVQLSFGDIFNVLIVFNFKLWIFVMPREFDIHFDLCNIVLFVGGVNVTYGRFWEY